jgi:hypothetical protein
MAEESHRNGTEAIANGLGHLKDLHDKFTADDDDVQRSLAASNLAGELDLTWNIYFI